MCFGPFRRSLSRNVDGGGVGGQEGCRGPVRWQVKRYSLRQRSPGPRFSEHPRKLGGGGAHRKLRYRALARRLPRDVWSRERRHPFIQTRAEGEEEARTRSLLGTPTPAVVRVGSDLALPLDASRAQSHYRGTGQCREDHHSLPVVSNYWVDRVGWASH